MNDTLTIEDIARVAHAAVRALQKVTNQAVSPPWKNLDKNHKGGFTDLVEAVLSGEMKLQNKTDEVKAPALVEAIVLALGKGGVDIPLINEKKTNKEFRDGAGR